MIDPDLVAVKNGCFFGLPYKPEEAEIAILSVPWDVTTSYRDGTARGPRAMLEASYQLDFLSPYRSEAWKTRIATLPTPARWLEKSLSLRTLAKTVIEGLENGDSPELHRETLDRINREGAAFHAETEAVALEQLRANRKIVTLGGDHSVSLGPIRALASRSAEGATNQRQNFSVLHIDAHADLRVAYEGFEYSHASIMHHVKNLAAVEKLVQVGLRDLSPREHSEIMNEEKITAHFDWEIRRRTADGMSWADQCRRMVEPLGQQVYLSIDIDGLDPRFCPSTGTPVPGGLEYWELFTLLEEVERTGRRFIGADLVEVAPGETEWDANVGARILFQLCQFLRSER